MILKLTGCRLVEPVFVQITYNGKVLVEKNKIFPHGSQRPHSTVLAEKKAVKLGPRAFMSPVA